MERNMSDSSARKFERWLSRKEAAQYLTGLGMTMSAQTLARLYSECKGPECGHIGRRAAYRPSDLMQYFRDQTSAPNRSPREPRRPGNDDDLPEPAND